MLFSIRKYVVIKDFCKLCARYKTFYLYICYLAHLSSTIHQENALMLNHNAIHDSCFNSVQLRRLSLHPLNLKIWNFIFRILHELEVHGISGNVLVSQGSAPDG